MSVARNLVASYASQILITAISIGAVPLYLRYMGLEPYGLVGVYVTLQAWFLLLDLGLSPTMLRETARYKAGTISPEAFRGLLRSMEVIFFGLGLTITAAVMLGARLIATDWLNVRHLSPGEVTTAVLLMAPSLGLRFTSTLYRSTLNGLGEVVRLSSLNLIAAVARFGLVIPYLMFVSRSPVGYFTFQLVVSAMEAGALVVQTYRLSPAARTGPSWGALRGVMHFSAGLAFASTVWSIVNQSDKLVLSKVLPLGQYAVFTLATVVAGGVLVLSTPAGPALIPRLTALGAVDDWPALTDLYRRATQLIVLLSGTAAAALSLFAQPLLWAWTGQRAVAIEAAPVLALYATGNALVAAASLPIYLQFALGRIRLHVLGQALLLVTMVPLIVVAASRAGMVGAGRVWLGGNLLFLLGYIPLVHRRLLPGLHGRWMLKDVIGTALPGVVLGLILSRLVTWPEDRLWSAVLVVGASGAMLACSGLGQRWVRAWLRHTLRQVLHGPRPVTSTAD